MPENGDTIKTPVGTVKKKTAAIVGLGLGGVFLVAWYRSKQAANAAPAATDTSSTDTSNIDPATGYPYGSAEDAAALQSQGGLTYQATGQGILGYPQYNTGPGTFTTNGQWAQYAEQYITDTAGGDANTVAAALGKYITGQALTADQVSVVQEAIAFAGYPPVNGPNGNPPGYVTGGTGGGGTGTVAVPNVIGKNRKDSAAAITAAGLVYKQANIIKGTAHASAESPAAGTMVAAGSTVTVTMKKG